jgi:hypothetical protein
MADVAVAEGGRPGWGELCPEAGIVEPGQRTSICTTMVRMQVRTLATRRQTRPDQNHPVPTNMKK